MRVFISWSKDRSHRLAQELRAWMPRVIQSIDPFISSNDIEKGARWTQDLDGQLEGTDFGVACLVPENLTEPWIQFEAGAVSKSIQKDKKGRVAPILFGVAPSDLTHNPLTWFQSTNFDKGDMRKLMEDINQAGGSEVLKPDILDNAFEMHWTQFEAKVRVILKEGPPLAVRGRHEKELDELALLGKEQMKRLMTIEERLSQLAPGSVQPSEILVTMNVFEALQDVAARGRKTLFEIREEVGRMGGGEVALDRLSGLITCLDRLHGGLEKAKLGGYSAKAIRSAMPDLRRALAALESW